MSEGAPRTQVPGEAKRLDLDLTGWSLRPAANGTGTTGGFLWAAR